MLRVIEYFVNSLKATQDHSNWYHSKAGCGFLFAVTLRHSVNNRLVKRLPPAFYIGLHAVWNYGIVTPFL